MKNATDTLMAIKYLATALSLMTVIACGEEKPPVFVPDGSRRDTGTDGGVDGGADGSTDGSGRDTGPDAGINCAPDEVNLGTQMEPSLAGASVSAVSDGFRVIWSDGEKIQHAELNSDLSARVRNDIGSGDFVSEPVTDGNISIWVEDTMAGDGLIKGKIHASNTDFTIDPGKAKIVFSPAIYALGSDWLITWVDASDMTMTIEAADVSAAGVVSNMRTLAPDVSPFASSMAEYNGTTYFSYVNSANEAFLAEYVVGTGQLKDPGKKASGTLDVRSSALVAMHKLGGIVVFEAHNGVAYEIFGRRLDGLIEFVTAAPAKVSLGQEQEARQPQLITYRGGYALFYRGWTSGAPDPVHRVGFVHGGSGNNVFSQDVDVSLSSFSHYGIAVNAEGQIVSIHAQAGGARSVVTSTLSCGDVWLQCSQF